MKQQTISPVQYYNNQRLATEHDLVGMTYSLLKHLYSPLAAHEFITNPYIAEAITRGRLQQQLVINQYFTFKLYQWRSYNYSQPVYDTTFLLTMEGSVGDWVNNFVSYVLPFMKNNSILGA